MQACWTALTWPYRRCRCSDGRATEAIHEWGADATRMGLADAGDGVEDANFVEDFTNKCILRLHTFVDWIEVNDRRPTTTGTEQA